MSVDLIALALEDIGRWDSQLLELVKDRKVDPWDININKLTEEYLEKINRMRELDFRIPGKAVMTASVLLRMKSDRMLEDKREQIERERSDALPFEPVELPALKPIRRLVERKITILELVDALRGAFEIEKSKIQRRSVIKQVVNFSMFDMSQMLETLRQFLEYKFRTQEKIEIRETFNRRAGTESVEGKNQNSLIFLGLLHLANDNYITLEQEEWNSPIYIRKLDLGRKIEPSTYTVIDEISYEEEVEEGGERPGQEEDY